MKIFKKIGISMVLLSALFVSCGTNDDDDSSSSGDSSGFTVGSEISFDGGKYLVLKNDFASSLSASANISSRAVIKSDSGSYYQNENAEKLRRNKIESDYGISNYIELFKVTTRIDASKKGIASLEDVYLILNESKKEIFKVTQKWSSTTLFASENSVAKRSEQFKALTENQIREYDPDYFTYENKKALYGNDLSKKILTQYVYTRSKNEKTVDYTKIDSIRDWKDYKKMSDKKEKAVWRSAVYNPGTEDPSTSYYLLNMAGSNFLSIYTETNYISAEGEGALTGSTSTSDWQGVVIPESVNAEAATFNVRLRDEDKEILNNAFTVTYSNLDSTKEAKTSDAEYYITVSSEKTKLTVNGTETEVPSAVTFRAPFKDTSAELQPYTSVSWKPEVENDEIVYKPDYESWIAAYDADFATLYDKSIQ